MLSRSRVTPIVAPIVAAIVAVSALTSCSRNFVDSVSIRAIQEQIDDRVQDAVKSNDAVRSALFGVRSVPTGFEYHTAAGQRSAGAPDPVSSDDQFMIASVTKTFVATRLLQLTESDVIGLDDRLADLGVFSADVVEKLHRIGNESFGDRITIRHLLNHRSGLKDYLLDDRQQTSKHVEGGVAPGSLAGIWLTHLDAFLSGGTAPGCEDGENCGQILYPSRQWPHWDAAAFAENPGDRGAGLLNFYLSEMADAALFPPGDAMHYSDTNYLLLGLIIESLTEMTLDDQLRIGIYEPLGMSDTYVSYTGRHPHPTERVSDWYALDIPMVSTGADTSWDWAGGGIVTTTDDLLAFITALMDGQLFIDPATLDTMLNPNWIDESSVRAYGLGIGLTRTDLGPRWGHSGAWGAMMYYFPDHGVAVVGTVNDYGSGPVGNRLTMEIANAVTGG